MRRPKVVGSVEADIIIAKFDYVSLEPGFEERIRVGQFIIHRSEEVVAFICKENKIKLNKKKATAKISQKPPDVSSTVRENSL